MRCHRQEIGLRSSRTRQPNEVAFNRSADGLPALTLTSSTFRTQPSDLDIWRQPALCSKERTPEGHRHNDESVPSLIQLQIIYAGYGNQKRELAKRSQRDGQKLAGRKSMSMTAKSRGFCFLECAVQRGAPAQKPNAVSSRQGIVVGCEAAAVPATGMPRWRNPAALPYCAGTMAVMNETYTQGE